MTKPQAPRGATIAAALASAFLAGDWDPPAMGRRGKRALADRRHWVTHLAEAARVAYPERPADRPRELARFIESCAPFRQAVTDRSRPLSVAVWIAAPGAMAAPRWPVRVLHDLDAVATWLSVDLDHLAWFADRRSLERTVRDERLRHHRRRWLGKADGTARLLEAPKRELKDLQRQVLRDVLDRIPVHEAAHGFRRHRSVHTAAAPHCGQAVVVRLDLEAFFTSVGAARTYGLFRMAGYPEVVAHTLTGLCTTVTPLSVLRDAPAPPADRVDERRRMLRGLREPHLAQGAPTSPALANLAAHGLDRRLAGLAASVGARYTRYADDLVLSGDRDLLRTSGGLVRTIATIAREEGFRIHERKTRVATGGQRQVVTGLVVNAHPNVPRAEYDRLRAVLHDAAQHGPEHANRAAHPAFREHLQGRIAWVGTGNPARAEKLRRAFDEITW
jgi:hypothetical protein